MRIRLSNRRMQTRLPVFYLIFTFALNWTAGVKEDLQNQDLPTTVWTELNGNVTLPCNISTAVGDKMNMLLWFKDSTGIPIYSFDARGVDYSNGIHMAMSDLEKRCSFISSGSKRGNLEIQKITRQDAGLYKCRVDFLNSPTQHFKVTVAIAESPTTPIIETPDGSEVKDVLSPFREGESMDLRCSVNNGNPTPRLSWWVDEEHIRGITEENELKVHSHLMVHSVPRNYNAKLLRCRVNVTGVSKTLDQVVRLNVHVKPLAVSILNGNNIVTDGDSAKFVCDCFGSNPPAFISWLLDGEAIKSSAITVMQSSNTTTSTLTIRVDPSFDGKSLLCKCGNPQFNAFFLEDKKILQVHYKPSIQILTRPKYNFNKVKEGDNFSLECQVNANPPVNSVQWYHNGKVIDLETKMIYNLRNVSLYFEGEYECEASNKEGRSRSPKLMVNILHTPFCHESYEKQSVIASIHETVILQCEVDTGPTNRHVQFFWTFNGTTRIESVRNDRIQSAGKISILKYTPETEEDFGTIACWSQNDIGLQKVPCYFYLTFANKPSRPRNCATNNTNDLLKISCDAGFDGGLQQYFVLEISIANTSSVGDEINNNEISSDQPYDQGLLMNSRTKKISQPLLRMQKEKPVFDIFSLESEFPYLFTLYAVNLKGRSEPVFLTRGPRVAKNIVSSEMSAQQDTLTMPSIYIAIMAIILLISSLVIMTAIILACRSRKVIRRENDNELNNFRIAYSDQVEDKRVSNYEAEF